jgi:Ca2+-binding RTX toxin-like protein
MMQLLEKKPFKTQTNSTQTFLSPAKDIVFIDTAVSDYNSLIAGIKPGLRVVILDPTKDGITQITESLAVGTFKSIHIVSHGTQGSLQLGATQLNTENIAVYSHQLEQWANTLTNDADILLYGCDVANGEGTKFVQEISQLTGANVAASINKTGSAALGGDWNLEFSVGEINSSLAFQTEAMQAYNGVLAVAGDVIINEFSQGSSGGKEWVEILVVKDNLNLQNHKLVDESMSGAGSLNITLSGDGFKSLKAGTLIVLYNGKDVDSTIAPDLTYDPTKGDYVLQVSSLNSSGLFAVTRTTGWNDTSGSFNNSTNTDVPRLLNDSGTEIAKFARTTTPGGSLASAYLGNTASGATNSANWSANFNSAGANPGLANGGANTTWINSLRVNDAPVLNKDIDSKLPTINEDISNADNKGILVADLIKNLVTDTNKNAQGIAVTGLSGYGKWQYSLNGGTNWTDFSKVSDASATVLAGLTPLYNGALGGTPNTQGWLQFGATPPVTIPLVGTVPVGGTQTANGVGTNLVSTTDGAAGYSNYNGGLPISLNPAFPVLDRNQGFTLSFDLKINSESHSSSDYNNDGIQDRAGFSVIVVTSDNTKAIELDFWGDQIWAQNDGSNTDTGSTGTLFTHSKTESVSYDTKSALTRYDLKIQGDTYYLFAAGGTTPILSGSLRNYTAFDHTKAGPAGLPLPYDPYERTNFVFLGDNTSSAQADVTLQRVELQANTRVRFVPNPGYDPKADINFRAWDGTDGSVSGATGVNTSVNGLNSAFSTSLEIATIAINHNPVDVNLGDSFIAENSSNNKVVGTLYAADPDFDSNASSFTYTLLNNAGGRFALNGNQIVVANGSLLDFESSSSHVIRVRVTDNYGGKLEKDLTISVKDVNEAPTAITINNTTVAENSAGAVIGNLTVSDPDAGSSHTFSLNDDRFEVKNGQLKLKDGISLDFETSPNIQLQVTATDNGTPALSKTQSFAIGVTDVNEAPTAVTINNSTVAENSAGAVIGNLTVSDPDAGSSHTFSLNDDRFEVKNGQLKLKDGISLDFETTPKIELLVTATDNGTPLLSKTQSFVIGVTDVNEAPTAVTINNSTVAENSAGAVIGNLTVSDPDAGSSHTFSLNDDRFEVKNGQLKLKDGISLDFETTPKIELLVTATDNGTPLLSKTQSFVIGVTDVNEAPTAVTINNSTVAENSAGAVIGNLTVSDPDAGSSHTFSLNDDRFEVKNGQLKLKDGISLDFETSPNIQLQVTATDNGTPALSKTQSFVIGVTDVNEAPTAVTINNSTVAENSAGAVIGNLTVSDPDAGSSHTFSLNDDRFEVKNGQLKLKDGISLDFETSPNIELQVTATDNGTPVLSATQNLTIGVTNVNESPIVANTISNQGSQAGAVFNFEVPANTFIDVDAGDSLTYSATLANDSPLPSWLSFNPATRTFSGTPGYGDVGSLNIKVSATDNAGVPNKTTFSIDITQAGNVNIVTGTDVAETFVVTDKTDIIDAKDGDDIVTGAIANLRQNDIINGGAGKDTFILSGGSVSDALTIDFGNPNNQIQGISGLVVSNFESFDARSFAGTISSIGGAGNDTIYGGRGADILRGGDGNDTLRGGAGKDLLIGGNGNDTYFADAEDIIQEEIDGGTDTVLSSISYTLGANLENLTLRDAAAINGTGNALNNRIIGNIADNVLSGGDGDDILEGGAGNDILDGGAGKDRLIGGDGDDIYYTDGSDRIDETINGGTDTVYASSSYTLANNLENLILIGDAAINGIGNALNNTIIGNNARNTLRGGDGDDILIGDAGNDTLDGGAGKDFLNGGDGDDSYYIDANDTIEESITGGTDTVFVAIDYALGANLENLTLRGDEAIDGTGNALNNTIKGNNANNILSGGDGSDRLYGGLGNDTLLGENGDDILVGEAGNDTLTGGAGKDQFRFYANAAFSTDALGVDTITDFTTKADRIVLYKNTFTALNSVVGKGFSVANEFALVKDDAAAATSSALIVYNSSSGKLFYNENGIADGFGTGAHFVTLTNTLSLTATDFLIQ